LDDARLSVSGSLDATSKIEKLEKETYELKQLLASANQLNDEVQEARYAAEDELQKKERELENALLLLERREEELRKDDAVSSRHNVKSSEGLEDLVEKETQLQRLLDNERATIETLRTDISELQQALETSKAEAAAANQERGEFRDQSKRHMQKVIQTESRVAALENENARLKRASQRDNSDRDSEVARLSVDLRKAKAELDSTKQTLLDVEEKLRLVEKEKENLDHELSCVRESISRLDVPALESENRRLQQEVTILQTELEASVNDEKENVGTQNEISDLNKQVTKLTEKLRSKDERIKKLEAVKLTKDKVAALKKLKVRLSDFAGLRFR